MLVCTLLTVGVRAGVIATFDDQENIPNYTSGTVLGTFSVSGTPDLYMGYTFVWNSGTTGSNKFVVLYFNNPNSGVNFGLKSNQGTGGEDFMVRFGSGLPIDYAPDQISSIPTSLRIVGRIQDTNNSGNYDTASLWIDPTVSDLNNPGAEINGFSMSLSPSPIGLRSVNLEAGDDIDLLNIVITDDFASAIPEPASLLLLLGGIPLLLARRKRRR